MRLVANVRGEVEEGLAIEEYDLGESGSSGSHRASIVTPECGGLDHVGRGGRK